MKAHIGQRLTWRVAALLLAVWLVGLAGNAAAAGEDPARVVRLRAAMEQAKKEGAKGQLPQAWWDLESRLEAAEKSGATEAQWQRLEADAERLRNSAVFVAQMRKQKSGMEALLGRFDQALVEIAALYDVEPDPRLSGSSAARDLLERLGRQALQRQVMIDSLTVENRRLNETVQHTVVYQDSMITALRVQVSALRQKLWETELRAGVAEADRSAAENVLTRKQKREEAIKALGATFGPEEGEVLLTPEGDILLRLFAVSFGIGSAELRAGQQPLIARVADAARLFPGAELRVEGHTDDTGSRDANLRLSRRRAETVARALEQEMGWAGETIATEGFGPDRPIALNSTAEGRARNRRIDVMITGGP